MIIILNIFEINEMHLVVHPAQQLKNYNLSCVRTKFEPTYLSDWNQPTDM